VKDCVRKVWERPAKSFGRYGSNICFKHCKLFVSNVCREMDLLLAGSCRGCYS